MAWSASAIDRYLKFSARVALTRLGVLGRIEQWRIDRLIRSGRPHESDFAFFRHTDGFNRLFVDIGANIGQSALSFRLFNRAAPILSFEPNPDMDWHLRRTKAHLGDSFDYRLQGVGAENEERRYYLPVVDGVPLTQEATFVPDLLSSDAYRQRVFDLTGRRRYRVEERVLQVVRLDDLELRPGVVKIDVQGGEVQVLRGMTRTIDRDRPLFLIEHNGEANRFLTERDYSLQVYRPELGALVPWQDQPAVLNFFCVPRERLAEWQKRGVARCAA